MDAGGTYQAGQSGGFGGLVSGLTKSTEQPNGVSKSLPRGLAVGLYPDCGGIYGPYWALESLSLGPYLLLLVTWTSSAWPPFPPP